jgi:hypothetical protein
LSVSPPVPRTGVDVGSGGAGLTGSGGGVGVVMAVTHSSIGEERRLPTLATRDRHAAPASIKIGNG